MLMVFFFRMGEFFHFCAIIHFLKIQVFAPKFLRYQVWWESNSLIYDKYIVNDYDIHFHAYINGIFIGSYLDKFSQFLVIYL
jgi:hypothetical protein